MEFLEDVSDTVELEPKSAGVALKNKAKIKKGGGDAATRAGVSGVNNHDSLTGESGDNDASDPGGVFLRPRLESPEASFQVIGGHVDGWATRLDGYILEALGNHRRYDMGCVTDLLRVIRNKRHHFGEFPRAVQVRLGSAKEGLVRYFTAFERFPALLPHCYNCVLETDASAPGTATRLLGEKAIDGAMPFDLANMCAFIDAMKCATAEAKAISSVAATATVAHPLKARGGIRSGSGGGSSGSGSGRKGGSVVSPDIVIRDGFARDGTDTDSCIETKEAVVGEARVAARPSVNHQWFCDATVWTTIPLLLRRQQSRLPPHSGDNEGGDEGKTGGDSSDDALAIMRANPRYKIKLCRDWEKSGGTKCGRGELCDYAHGLAQLRVAWNAVWPGNETATVVGGNGKGKAKRGKGKKRVKQIEVKKGVAGGEGAAEGGGGGEAAAEWVDVAGVEVAGAHVVGAEGVAQEQVAKPKRKRRNRKRGGGGGGGDGGDGSDAKDV
jgi:hypothetical protein